MATLAGRAASLLARPLANKILVARTPGAGLVEGVTPLAQRVAWGGMQLTVTEDRMRRLVSELVDKTIGTDRELEGLSDERRLISEALVATLMSLGELDMAMVEEAGFDHQALAKRLRADKPPNEKEMSADAVVFYDNILRVCSLHILEFFSEQPEFSQLALLRSVQILKSLDLGVLQVLDRITAESVLDRQFEIEYGDSIAKRYAQLTVFGIDLKDMKNSSWPLDMAYTHLEMVQGGRYAPNGGVEAEWLPAARRAHIPHSSHTALPTEAALAGQERVFVRGVAGSGKTTLVQWLAVTTAQQGFSRTLESLNGKVPFVLPLRTLARRPEGLPRPNAFLEATGHLLAGSEPQGWVVRIMKSGRALLMVDGIDEVTEEFRQQAHAWLRELLQLFPQTVCVVTARPSSVPDAWLARERFVEFALSPMKRRDVRLFVNRWHQATRTTIAADETLARAELETYQEKLLETIDLKPDLARIASNPLMCAVVCALNRDRRGRLPKGRQALYEAALRMLLSERDEQRYVSGPERITLDEEEQRLLLQRLAYWLMRNGQSETSTGTFARMIREALPRMSGAGAGAGAGPRRDPVPQMLSHLINRSGVLREPSSETVEFIHRTFQDYLGARAAVDDEDFDFLVQRAHDALWEDAIRMAVGHCRPRERDEFLQKIMERAQNEPEFSARLHLLGLVCLEHSAEVDPDIRRMIESTAADIVPPATLEQAERLSQVGPFLLELLPGPDGLTPMQARSVVRAAALIGGTGAVRVISQYAGTEDEAVRSDIVEAWSEFDPDEYAEMVLTQSDFVVRVVDAAQARASGRLDRSGHFICTGETVFAEYLGHLPAATIRKLFLGGDRGEAAGHGMLAAFRLLTDLELVDCSGLTDLGVLDGLALTRLTLKGLPLRTMEGLSRQQRLNSLTVDQGNLATALRADFPHLPRLRDLRLAGLLPLESLCEAFPGVRRLQIAPADDRISLEWLEGMDELEDLDIHVGPDSVLDFESLPGSRSLKRLSVYGRLPLRMGERDLESLGRLPCLESVTLRWAEGPGVIRAPDHIPGKYMMSIQNAEIKNGHGTLVRADLHTLVTVSVNGAQPPAMTHPVTPDF
ncbi:NACHT domain-containing protein [Streptomyces sp. NPDC005070]